MKDILQSSLQYSLLLTGVLTASSAQAALYAVGEDVMTSPFLFGPNYVRGYAGDSRNEHYVTADDPFGFGNPATIYLDFSSVNLLSDFSAGQQIQATLTLQSVVYPGYSPGSAGNPFYVSAHGVNDNPLTSITDDTNPSGTTSWSNFYHNNLIAADAAATTAVECVNCAVTFDVSALVSDWLNGGNTEQFVALSGSSNSPSDGRFHGFLNNTENPGSTYLQVTAVPVPAAAWLFASGLASLVAWRQRSVSQKR